MPAPETVAEFSYNGSMAAPQSVPITAEEYLALERSSTGRRSEFWDGQIVAMSGARLSHIKIVSNLVRRLGNALDGSGCQVLSNDMRVAADPVSKYFYPDVAIVCQLPEFIDDQFDTLLNPVVVIEVLSPSTENLDRTIKLDAYRAISSLNHYVLIDSRKITVHHYERQSETNWLLRSLDDQADSLILRQPPVSLSLDHIYQEVSFNSTGVDAETSV
jgi:Uma2 family endonuclease